MTLEKKHKSQSNGKNAKNFFQKDERGGDKVGHTSEPATFSKLKKTCLCIDCDHTKCGVAE